MRTTKRAGVPSVEGRKKLWTFWGDGIVYACREALDFPILRELARGFREAPGTMASDRGVGHVNGDVRSAKPWTSTETEAAVRNERESEIAWWRRGFRLSQIQASPRKKEASRSVEPNPLGGNPHLTRSA